MTKNEMENLFQNRLPEEIVKELTPEVRRQYFLWDEIMKREIELYPWLIFPVIKESFRKEYPVDEKIVLLSTEYTVSRIHEKGEKLLHAIRSDLLLKIKCGMILDREGSRGVLRENAQKDIREFLWKACGYLLEKDARLYEEVSVEVEPAIKLSREIIEELRDDIKGLQKGNRELQDSNKEFLRKQENSCRNLIRRLRGEGKSMEEAEEALVEVFSLTKQEAEEKVRLYWEKVNE